MSTQYTQYRKLTQRFELLLPQNGFQLSQAREDDFYDELREEIKEVFASPQGYPWPKWEVSFNLVPVFARQMRVKPGVSGYAKESNRALSFTLTVIPYAGAGHIHASRNASAMAGVRAAFEKLAARHTCGREHTPVWYDYEWDGVRINERVYEPEDAQNYQELNTGSEVFA